MVTRGFFCEVLRERYGKDERKSIAEGNKHGDREHSGYSATRNRCSLSRFIDNNYFESFFAASACSAAVQGGTTPLVLAYAMDWPRCSWR